MIRDKNRERDKVIKERYRFMDNDKNMDTDTDTDCDWIKSLDKNRKGNIDWKFGLIKMIRRAI